MDLKSFTKQLSDFEDITPADKIDYFAYYLTVEAQMNGFKARDIADCFDQLDLRPYTNIPSYLGKHSKSSGTKKYLKKKESYFLDSRTKKSINALLNNEQQPEASNNLYPLSIFENTRGYLIAFGHEAAVCYDTRLYNSCFFMLRKILEVLIIDIYERHKVENEIKNNQGNYVMLSDLISKLCAEKRWNVTKNVKQEMPKIKKLADSSVHNKYFSARKPDIDNLKTDIRIIIQELITMIDYPTWSKH